MEGYDNFEEFLSQLEAELNTEDTLNGHALKEKLVNGISNFSLLDLPTVFVWLAQYSGC